MGGSGLVALDLANFISKYKEKYEVHFLGFEKPYFDISNNNIIFHNVDSEKYELFDFELKESSLINKTLELDDEFNFDVINIHYGIVFGNIIPFIKRKENKVVLTFHGSDLLGWNADFSDLPKFSSLIYRISKISDNIVFASKSLKEKFKNLIVDFDDDFEKWEKKIEIITNSTTAVNDKKDIIDFNDIEKKYEEKIKNKFVVFHASNFRKVKQTELIVEMLKDERILNSEIVFVLAGNGDGREELVKKLSDEILADRVIFLGKISLEEVHLWMKKVNLSLLMSYYENASLFLIDSLFLGTPVLASAVGGNPEIVDNNKNGVIIEKYREYKEYVDKIIDIKNNKIKLKNREEIMLDSEKRFSKKNIYSKYLDLYNS